MIRWSLLVLAKKPYHRHLPRNSHRGTRSCIINGLLIDLIVLSCLPLSSDRVPLFILYQYPCSSDMASSQYLGVASAGSGAWILHVDAQWRSCSL